MYQRDTSGNTSRESIYGGDAQPVNAEGWANLCTVGLPSSPAYRVDHTWEFGVRKRSAEVDPASGVEYLLTLDADIDSNTGRTARARDSAEVATDYDYDVLGRLVWIKPREGPWLRNEFERATGASPALVRTCRKLAGVATPCSDNDNGQTVQRWEVRFDGFGRPHQEIVRLPGAPPIVTTSEGPPSAGEQPAAGTWWENYRKTAFNALGWKTWESEWHQRTDPLPADSQLKKTEFLNFDPFGRPGRILKPDQTFTDFAYTGVRLLARTVTVSGQAATTEEEYDRHGRLRRLKEPIAAGLEATYTYDVGDRLTGATLVGGAQSQNRTWSYDGRGLLRQETVPEIGAEGHGTIFYPRYDARGKLLRRQDPRTRLSFSYDPAGRPLETWEADAAWQNQRLLQSWSYATANGSGDLAKGKLRSAVGYTYWDDATVTVTETYTYGGLAGAVSTRRTRIQVGGGLGGAFDEAFDLELGWGQHSGQIERLRYPQLLGWSSPNGEAAKQAPRRRVDYRFQDGLLTSVLPYYATKLTYHANFLLAELVHARREVTVDAGVQDRTYLDADTRMARPWRILTQGVTPLMAGGAGNWSSGRYQYDAVGNITAQLADGVKSETETFTYDRLSRLTHWLRDGVANESYGFDVFGNLVQYNGRTLPVVGATNRLAAAGYDASGNM
ncbi:MAG: RHS repeat protein, partial [Acidobacteriota bacterium]